MLAHINILHMFGDHVTENVIVTLRCLTLSLTQTGGSTQEALFIEKYLYIVFKNLSWIFKSGPG